MGELGTKNRRMGSEKEKKVGLGGQWARKYIPSSSFSALAVRRRRRRGEFLGRRLERQHLLFRASKKVSLFFRALTAERQKMMLLPTTSKHDLFCLERKIQTTTAH